jgi:hypothetical protein
MANLPMGIQMGQSSLRGRWLVGWLELKLGQRLGLRLEQQLVSGSEEQVQFLEP